MYTALWTLGAMGDILGQESRLGACRLKNCLHVPGKCYLKGLVWHLRASGHSWFWGAVSWTDPVFALGIDSVTIHVLALGAKGPALIS